MKQLVHGVAFLINLMGYLTIREYFLCESKKPRFARGFDYKTVEREGFEPSILLNTVYPLSRRAPSAARPPLQNDN